MSCKANFLLIALLLGGGVSAQESPVAPLGPQFASDSRIFTDMHKVRVAVCQQDCAEEDVDTDAIRQTYAELYQSESYQVDGEEIADDAGIVVIEFKRIFGLVNALADLRAQPNLLYLTKDRYLIKVWSDSSRMGEQHLAAARRFYEDEHGAAPFEASEDRSIVDIAESAEAVDAVDANGLADYVEAPEATEAMDAAQPR